MMRAIVYHAYGAPDVLTGYSSLPLIPQHLVLGRVVSRLGGKKIGAMLARLK